MPFRPREAGRAYTGIGSENLILERDRPLCFPAIGKNLLFTSHSAR
jgi:hypothetical protein